jgi:predicted dithiol-disulfide oxidoreductase (DUF899 family)
MTDDWIAASGRSLAKEREFTRLHEELSREQRELPWEYVNKEYVFESENGGETLVHLFGGRSHLIVYHFMYEPDCDIGCKNCSFWADNFNGIIPISTSATCRWSPPHGHHWRNCRLRPNASA